MGQGDFLISICADVSVKNGTLFYYFFEDNKSFDYLVQHCNNLEEILYGIDKYIYYKYFSPNTPIKHIICKNIQLLIENGLDVNKIVSNVNYHIYKYFFSLEINDIQYFVNNGLRPNNDMLYYAIIYDNIKLMNFLLDYGLVFDAECTLKIFNDCDIDRLYLILKYDCDFSLVRYKNPKSPNVYSQLMDKGFPDLVYFLLERNIC